MKMRATGSACRCCRIVAVFFYCKNVQRPTIQVRNGKKTAILALMDETSKKGKNKKPDSKLFYVYRSTILKKPRILVDLPLI